WPWAASSRSAATPTNARSASRPRTRAARRRSTSRTRAYERTAITRRRCGRRPRSSRRWAYATPRASDRTCRDAPWAMPTRVRMRSCTSGSNRVSCWPTYPRSGVPTGRSPTPIASDLPDLVPCRRFAPCETVDTGPNLGERSEGLEVGHHHHVLVLQVVAVHDVLARIVGEPDGDFDDLARSNVDGVLPALVVRAGAAPSAPSDLERVEVDVHRMMNVGDEAPHLDLAPS